MKKLLGAILFASLLLTISCSHDTEESSGSSYDQAGKKHFLVLTNTSSADIPFDNIPSAKNGRSAVSNSNSIPIVTFDDYEPKIKDVYFDDFGLLNNLKNNEINPRFISSFSQTGNSDLSNAAVDSTHQFYINLIPDDKGMPDLTKNQLATFKLKASGNRCNIWFRDPTLNNSCDEPSISDTVFQNLASALDNVFEKELSIYGSNVINSSGLIQASNETKLNVIIYDILADKQPSENAVVGGFFSSKDLFMQSVIDGDRDENIKKMRSNLCECIYADSYLLNKDQAQGTKYVTSTLIHEFQHMLHFINKNIKNVTLSEVWFNEMLSMCAEDIFQTQLGCSDLDSPKGRLSQFNANYYDGFKNWRSGNEVLKSYANAYAFGAYLMRNYGGVNLIHQIANNPYVNEKSITEALKACGFDETFNSVLLKFSEAIVYPTDSSKHTLYKSWNQNFNGINYSLTAINLLDYANLIADSSLQYIYDSENRKFTTSDGRTAIKGPVILNEGAYYQGGNLGAYGTHGIYLGIKNYKPSYANTDGVTQTLLYMD